MTYHTALLSSVAAMTLAGGLALVAPAAAQSSMNPPQYSSPQEQRETQQLNEQYVNGTNQTPAQLNGQTQQMPQGYYGGQEQPPYGTEDYNQQPDGYAPLPNNYYTPQYGYGSSDQNQRPDNDAYDNGNDQQDRYQQQQQQYQDQQQEYQDQRAQYQTERNRYRHNLSWYDQARWSYTYPRPYAYEYDTPRLRQLYLIAEPSQQLYNAPVEGPGGLWVGRIRDVDTSVDGAPLRVEIALNRRVSVWVQPGDLRFDADQHVAFTDLTREDLWQMPGATVESGPL